MPGTPRGARPRDRHLDPGRPDDGHRVASVAQWERETIGARTRESLAALKAQGRPVSRPAVADVAGLPERIQDMRAAGMTLQAIADALEADGVLTPRGLRWRPSSVQATLGYRRPRAPRRAVEMPEVRRRRRRLPGSAGSAQIL